MPVSVTEYPMDKKSCKITCRDAKEGEQLIKTVVPDFKASHGSPWRKRAGYGREPYQLRCRRGNGKRTALQWIAEPQAADDLAFLCCSRIGANGYDGKLWSAVLSLFGGGKKALICGLT